MKKLLIAIIAIAFTNKAYAAVETSFKATENVVPAWNFELRNRTTKPIKIKVINNSNDIFGEQNKLDGKSVLGLLKESSIPVVRSNDIDQENTTYIGIYDANNKFLKGYTINSHKPIFLSWENGALRPQKGMKTNDKQITVRTQSGLSLRKALDRNNYNVTEREIIEKNERDFNLLTDISKS